LTPVAINHTLGRMGDKSPKANQKQAAQKAKQKKNVAAASKQAPKAKK
jgi:hypothetical protein